MPNACRRATFAVFTLAILVAVDSRGQTAQPVASERIQSLINRLADPDPNVRTKAANSLREIGYDARSALIEASRSDHPSVSTSAAQVLVSIPFWGPDDPEVVRLALRDYSRPDPTERAEVAAQIAQNYPRVQANSLLLRLLREEPSEDVCWQIVALLRRRLDPETGQKLLEIQADAKRPALLTLLARVWLAKDRQVAHKLFAQAIETDHLRPAEDYGELSVAFDALAGAAMGEHRFDVAASVRRRQALRMGTTEQASDPLSLLLALHALHGPLTGFEQDLETFTSDLARPQILYCWGFMQERAGHTLLAEGCFRSAHAASMTPRQRLAVASFLIRMQQGGLAERELNAIVISSPKADRAEHAVARLNATMALASIAADRGDDADAAQRLRDAVAIVKSAGLVLERESPHGTGVRFEAADLQQEILWREFRAARSAGDTLTAEAKLQRLLSGPPGSTGMVLDTIDHLRNSDRHDEAQQALDRAYLAIRKRLSASKDDPTIMNELAWLCARADQRLDEAVELATRAVNAAPGIAAFLDTKAEACFRVGKIEEAIRLEEAALDLQPGDPFMSQQLKRFQGGASK